jgi:hypothetical protein
LRAAQPARQEPARADAAPTAEPAAPAAPAEPTAATITVPARQVPSQRGTNLFERVKELAFTRGGGERDAERPQYREAERMGLRVEEPRPSFAVAGDELGDIPAFLRRERVPS